MEIEFFCYRYFIIESIKLKEKDQMSIDEFIQNKNQIFRDLILQTKSEHRIETNNQFLYYTKNLDSSIYIMKFANQKNIKTHNPTEDDIMEFNEFDYPYITLIIDLEKQIILIQKTSSVFSDNNSAKFNFEKFISKLLTPKGYICKLDEITYKEEFWTIVSNAEKIYKLRLNLKSPNLFNGRHKANDIMKELKEDYNITEISSEIKNDEGLLELPQDRLNDKIDYITDGGGSYEIKYFFNGRKRNLKSSQIVRKVLISEDFSDIIKLQNLMRDIDETNTNTK